MLNCKSDDELAMARTVLESAARTSMELSDAATIQTDGLACVDEARRRRSLSVAVASLAWNFTVSMTTEAAASADETSTTIMSKIENVDRDAFVAAVVEKAPMYGMESQRTSDVSMSTSAVTVEAGEESSDGISSDSSSSNAGVIVGVLIGMIALVGIVGGVLYAWRKTSKNSGSNGANFGGVALSSRQSNSERTIGAPGSDDVGQGVHIDTL